MELINNFKNKSFIILSIILVLFFFVSSSVLGASEENLLSLTYNDNDYSFYSPFSENFDFDFDRDLFCIVTLKNGDNDDFYFLTVKDAKFYIDDGAQIEFRIRMLNNKPGKGFRAHYLGSNESYSDVLKLNVYQYNFNSRNWKQKDENVYAGFQNGLWWDLNNATFLYSQFDIYPEGGGDVLFHGAPLKNNTMFQLTGAEQIPQAMVKVVKIVLPVGLVILGIGLVILLIKSVIYRMK